VTPYFEDRWLTVYGGDCRAVFSELPEESVHCVVTSPPYWGLRVYGTPGQLGLEKSPEEYVASMVEVFRAVRRVLRADGTVWLNLGDAYASSPPGNTKTGVEKWSTSGLHGGVSPVYAATLDASVGKRRNTVAPGLKPKDLVGIPWRVAFALQADGWYLRSDIIWSKPNPMPESVTDRPTKSHEYLFLLSRSPRYFYDAGAVREANVSPEQAAHNARYAKEYRLDVVEAGQNNSAGIHARGNANGRNLRSVWTIPTAPYPGAHFATFPPRLVEPCVKAGCPPDGVVLDPFAGTGTVGLVAQRLGRRAILIDLNPDYLRQCLERNAQTPLGLSA
jgi:DNA modification methylase